MLEGRIVRQRTRRQSDLLARKSGLPACGPQHQARKCLPLGVDETGGLGPFRGLGASRALESMLADSPRTVPMDPAYTRWAAASLIAMVRAAVVLVIVVAFVVVVGMLRAAEVVLVNIRRDVAPEIGAGILIEAKMDASVDARVVDIARDLVEPGVVEGQPWHGGVRHGDGMAASTVDTPQDLGGAVASAGVIRRVARETRRENVRHKGEVGVGCFVAIEGALAN